MPYTACANFHGANMSSSKKQTPLAKTNLGAKTGLLYTWKQNPAPKRPNSGNPLVSVSNSPVKNQPLWRLSVAQMRQVLRRVGDKLSLTGQATKRIPLIINQNYEQNRLIHECEIFYQDLSEMVLKLQQQSKLWKKYATSEDYEVLLWQIDEVGKLISEFTTTSTRFNSLSENLHGQLADLIGGLQHGYTLPREEMASSKIRSSLHKTIVLDLVEKQEQSRINLLGFIRQLKQA
jgi:hypothetical protein